MLAMFVVGGGARGAPAALGLSRGRRRVVVFAESSLCDLRSVKEPLAVPGRSALQIERDRPIECRRQNRSNTAAVWTRRVPRSAHLCLRFRGAFLERRARYRSRIRSASPPRLRNSPSWPNRSCSRQLTCEFAWRSALLPSLEWASIAIQPFGISVRQTHLSAPFCYPHRYPCPFFPEMSGLPIHCPNPLKNKVERVKGIEPSSSAWKAVALPLSYTRIPVGSRQRSASTPERDWHGPIGRSDSQRRWWGR